MPVGETLTLTITIDPSGQNQKMSWSIIFALTLILDMVVRSQNFETTVYGRDLSGFAWYDDNLDGLIGNLANGNAEQAAKDIPVKLYRTSYVDETYKMN